MSESTTLPITNSAHRRISPAILWCAFACWLVAAIGGTCYMIDYSESPGAAAQAPASWPKNSTIATSPGRPTLLMFMHPQCPCSRASLGELERLLVRGTDRLNVHVLFLDPGNMEEGWTRSSLWEKAKAIPGVIVSLDPGGREAAHFNAITSGQVLVYDGQGKLAFDGGLTPARGHSGDSAGRAAVLALLDENLQQPVQTSVFGCALCETSEAN